MRIIIKVIIIGVNEHFEAVNRHNCSKGDESKTELPELNIDIISHKVKMNEKEVTLTNLEFNLLYFFASQPNRVFTYKQIYESVWGEPYACEKGNIMTHISHLKSKIDPDSTQPKFIENIRGVGYRFINE